MLITYKLANTGSDLVFYILIVQRGDCFGTDNGDFIICGLVGVAGFIAAKEEKAFRDLLVFDSIRGEHSTGVASVGYNDTEVVKAVGDPFELFNSAKYIKMMSGVHRVLIGHNRFATQGAVNKRNAHPFEAGDIIGVHNGTLTNKHMLFEAHRYVVDSEAIFNHINAKGIRDAVNTMCGAWALVWWNSLDGTLNFLRNKERTLFMARSKSTVQDTIFWASEKWMLEVALSRNQIEVEDIISLEPDMHLTIEIDSSRKIGKPTIVKMEVPTPIVTPVFQNEYQGGGVTPNNQRPSVFNINRKNVIFFGKGIDTDSCGASYLECEDVTAISDDFRLYDNGLVDIKTLLGCTFTGSIQTMCTRHQEGTYYKVSSSSVSNIGSTAPVVEKGPFFVDANSKLLTKKEWESKYEACSFCTAPLTAGAKNRFSKDGDCLCPDCVTDPSINSLLTLV